MNFTEIEKKVLYRMQQHLPFVARPYHVVADELNIKENYLLNTIATLIENKIIRNISGIFHAGVLGYASTLVAFIIPHDAIDRAAGIINAHPGVSHNYQRDHAYNIWFTLAVPEKELIERTVEYLAEKSGALDYLLLRNEKEYKIRVLLNLGENLSGGFDSACGQEDSVKQPGSLLLTEREKTVIALLQQDLPLVSRPFLKLNNIPPHVSEDEFLQTANRLYSLGALKRFAAVLRHRNSGYTVNGMTVWKPEQNIELVAARFKAEKALSHLYQRTVYPGKWEYPLYAMIHARSETELQNMVFRLAGLAGTDNYMVLRSLRELKKERVNYFSPAFQEWQQYII